MNTVEVTSRGIRRPSWLPAARRFCGAALRALGADGWELSVLVAGDRIVRELNRSYRGVDEATDVLSFSQLEGPAVPGATPVHEGLAGDVVVSLPTAKRLAAEAGAPLEQEIRRLLVHGILHLRGMDHEGDSGEMLVLQEQLLGRVRGRLF